jgi:hypothetical protein
VKSTVSFLDHIGDAVTLMLSISKSRDPIRARLYYSYKVELRYLHS